MKRLQAYLVPTLTDIAGIIGPPDTFKRIQKVLNLFQNEIRNTDTNNYWNKYNQDVEKQKILSIHLGLFTTIAGSRTKSTNVRESNRSGEYFWSIKSPSFTALQ